MERVKTWRWGGCGFGGFDLEAGEEIVLRWECDIINALHIQLRFSCKFSFFFDAFFTDLFIS